MLNHEFNVERLEQTFCLATDVNALYQLKRGCRHYGPTFYLVKT